MTKQAIRALFAAVVLSWVSGCSLFNLSGIHTATANDTLPHTLTVCVVQGSGALASPLAKATVTLGNSTLTTGSDGKAAFQVYSGVSSFSVAKVGYTPLQASATVSGRNLTTTSTLSLERKPSTTTDTYSPGVGWTLQWADEFASPTLDATKWTPQVLEAGHFNNELQSYTASQENAFIINRSGNDGALVIQALRTGSGNSRGDFTSARLITHGKGDWLYGKIAARLQVPFGQGLWPAFWMLGSNISENAGGTVSWPQCGEIDIMEKRGGTPAKERENLGTYHFANASNAWEYHTGTISLTNPLSNDFHVYEVEWKANSMVWRLDGNQYFSLDMSNAMYSEFRKNFYVLLNVAVGGSFDNGFDGTSSFPQSLFVDWVRVYQ